MSIYGNIYMQSLLVLFCPEHLSTHKYCRKLIYLYENILLLLVFNVVAIDIRT